MLRCVSLFFQKFYNVDDSYLVPIAKEEVAPILDLTSL